MTFVAHYIGHWCATDCQMSSLCFRNVVMLYFNLFKLPIVIFISINCYFSRPSWIFLVEALSYMEAYCDLFTSGPEVTLLNINSCSMYIYLFDYQVLKIISGLLYTSDWQCIFNDICSLNIVLMLVVGWCLYFSCITTLSERVIRWRIVVKSFRTCVLSTLSMHSFLRLTQKMFLPLNKTRNAWQSLAYSLLGIIVCPLADTYETHPITDHHMY